MKVTLIQSTPEPIEMIAKIASICYDSSPKDPTALVRHLYRNGHHSVFEHVYFTFLVEGISRGCSHQLVRHRHCSFTQRSQRYCSEASFDYVAPVTTDDYLFSAMMTQSRSMYNQLIASGAAREDARSVLPNACATSMYISCNLRELIHLANERLCYRAQLEIRDVIRAMCALVDPQLQFMLVPKCKSGRILCNDPCAKMKEETHYE